jgi:hypothetical protein
MMQDLRTILGVVLAAGLAFLFWRYVQKKKRAEAELPAKLFADILPLLNNTELKSGETIGTWQVTGTYRGKPFQLKAVADTLAVRKLPSLWLMITLPELQPNTTSTIDLMMRPQGPTTFSNFDFLQHTLSSPIGFPEDAVIRSDTAHATLPVNAMKHAVHVLQSHKGKELLISPKGLRIVLQAAEADRARYGVYREANFGDTVLASTTAVKIMDTLIALAEDLKTP